MLMENGGADEESRSSLVASLEVTCEMDLNSHQGESDGGEEHHPA